MLTDGINVYDDRNRSTFNSVDSLINYFNQNPNGKKLRDRKNLHLVVDLEIPDEAILKDLEGKLSSVKWAKAKIDYITSKTEPSN